MWKVKYDTVATMADEGFGNISQGTDVAYMECDLDVVEIRLEQYFIAKANDAGKSRPLHPIVTSVEKVDGHIVI